MVDLVKIRKKAKEKKERAQPEEPKTAGAPVSSPAPDLATTGAREDTRAPQSTVTDRLEKFLDHVGEKTVVEAVPAAVAAPKREMLTFVIDREHYAVDIEHVIEIVTPRPVTRVPNADALIVGIISLRGTVVTLMDVRRKLGHPRPETLSPDRRIVVIDHESEPVGFEVDRVLRVVKIDPESIEPHPVVHASEVDDAIRGVFRHGDALTILLDFAKLLGSRGPVSVFRGRRAAMRAPGS